MFDDMEVYAFLDEENAELAALSEKLVKAEGVEKLDYANFPPLAPVSQDEINTLASQEEPGEDDDEPEDESERMYGSDSENGLGNEYESEFIDDDDI